jgi:CelD/BcsL family acetyltransferase involved in cellulose biosynthesis
MPERIGRQINPMVALATMPHSSAAYMTALGADWDKFYAEKRSSSTRQRDRSKRKKLAAMGELALASPDMPERIRGTLGVLFGQKSRQFARMGVPDLFARPGHKEFFFSVASSARGFVHVSRLDVGATCAAANLGLLFRDCYFHILASYDDSPLSRFGPGAVHLHELMRHAIGQGCKRFDFTIGDEFYKRDWADTRIDLFDHVSGAGWLGRFMAMILTVTLRAKRRIKTSPGLWRVASQFRSLLASSKQRRRHSSPPARSSSGTRAAA